MFMHKLRRGMSALGTVLALSIALPIATGATPAYAVAELQVTKSHEGIFMRGGQGVYHIVITNTGTATTDSVSIVDILPEGLTLSGFTSSTNPVDPQGPSCFLQDPGFACSYTFPASSTLTINATVDIAANAPCGPITNEVTVDEPAENISISASDTTTITGTGCPNGDGDGDGGSILPVNLSGVVTLFNNINTNNNLLSPGATNTTHQNLGINAP
ncbi:hypothetical protein [Streptomyces sp. NPDC012888]|uniref:hypothetical protein n=1 Tax=Streptomyces sp. NPDC012888 TaxID=3364855 RepID=UPI0036AC3A35